MGIFSRSNVGGDAAHPNLIALEAILSGGIMADLGTQLASYALAAVIAAGITYYFSVRTTKKGKLFDAKLEVYSEILGHYQQALDDLDSISNLQDQAKLDLDDEGIVANILMLSTELTGLADTESLMLLSDPKRFAESLKEDGAEPLIQKLQLRAMTLFSTRFVKNILEVKFRQGKLTLVNPNERVIKALDGVEKTTVRGAYVILGKVVKDNPELFSHIMFPKEVEKVKTEPRDRAEEIRNSLKGLASAMREDLGKTISPWWS